MILKEYSLKSLQKIKQEIYEREHFKVSSKNFHETFTKFY